MLFNAAFVQDSVYLKAVTADIVFTEQVDFELLRLFSFAVTDNVCKELVVCDMVTCGLRDTLVPFATEGKDVAVAELLLHLLGNGMDIVTDQTYRTGGED